MIVDTYSVNLRRVNLIETCNMTRDICACAVPTVPSNIVHVYLNMCINVSSTVVVFVIIILLFLFIVCSQTELFSQHTNSDVDKSS